jgi:hypothetical protein
VCRARDLAFAQAIDRFVGCGGRREIDSAAGALSSAAGRLWPGQEDLQGGQVRQDAVLADVGVLRPA